MSLQDKIKNAKSTTWPAEGIPKWKVKLIMKWAVFKVKVIKKVKRWEQHIGKH